MVKFKNATNDIIKKCVKNLNFQDLVADRKNQVYDYNTPEEFNEILYKEVINFVKTFKPKNIDIIVYNAGNTDGIFSAAIAYHYFTEKLNKDIEIIKIGAGLGNAKRIFKKIKGKDVLFLDLSYSNDSYNKIKKEVKTLYAIDDHDNIVKDKNIFIGSGNFATCAYTWKIFYPRKKVPLFVEYVNDTDSKKKSKYIKKSNLITTAITFRYTKNPYIKSEDFRNGKVLKQIWDIIDESNPSFWVFIGKYFDEVQENIKEQIAKNAYPDKFQGYNVGVLNFLDPVLTKRVGRQIITNFENAGKDIDFAFLWGYDNGKNAFNIQIIDNHRQKKINLEKMAQILGKKGGHRDGGGGHFHVGHFYWPRDDKHDIWDLFTKKLLTDKDKKIIESGSKNAKA